jgi:hypothetical protein
MRDWRREDSVYAVLTALAGSFVLYLVAGNVGLVPPLTPSFGSSPPEAVGVAVAGATGGDQTPPAETDSPAPASGGLPAPGGPPTATPPPASPTPSPQPSPDAVGDLVGQIRDLLGL